MTDQADHARSPYLEVWLHNRSPLPPVLNGILISALLYALYLFYSIEVGQPIIDQAGAGVRFNSAAWAALVVCLIFGVATTMPAITQRQWQASLPQLKAVLDEEGGRKAEAMAKGLTRGQTWRSFLAFVLGAAAGFLVNVWLLNPPNVTWSVYWSTISPFFAVMNTIVFGLGARGGYMVRLEDREMRELIEGHLQVDLAHLDRNQIFGRVALRGALAWLVMTAVIMLFFVDSTPVPISAGSLILALIASGYVFAATIGPVVRKCSAARDAALQSVREQITASGNALLRQGASGIPVSELIAYESWLEKLPVWPISAPVTRRLALYGFIPVLAWFGSAAAELVLNRFT